LRFQGEAYRAHDPRWSWTPLSGDGAALRGGRFNGRGQPALYLSLTPMTAVREASAGFAHRLEPLLLCTYAVDCEDIVDLRDDAGRAAEGVGLSDLACPWALDLAEGRKPASHAVVERLADGGAAGVLVPSFAHGAAPHDQNLVLWRWGKDLPHKVEVHDPSGRLPKNQLSWD
jgi:RES domain-containing protein